MKYALLILEDPKGEVQVLNEGALLFPLGPGLLALSRCVAEAKARGLRSHTLFFDEEPSWIVTSPTSSTK